MPAIDSDYIIDDITYITQIVGFSPLIFTPIRSLRTGLFPMTPAYLPLFHLLIAQYPRRKVACMKHRNL
ncbi:hypothetical protein CORMATOL_01946 [Corynebacterium matruchotii ATCC 33806]|uniref:Uncharacterized protein n=1 Tax=Corynebacterium matruchotii ATCC 33806 TaxID=566549 RepID=C0E4M1_9CORY|nr:hypothetical protein CORMATOL_01946 [Corynebacterium matruchotii ATCC 33806]